MQGSQWVEQDRAFVLRVNGFAALPQPGTLLLLLGGLAAIGAVRMRRNGARRVAA